MFVLLYQISNWKSDYYTSGFLNAIESAWDWYDTYIIVEFVIELLVFGLFVTYGDTRKFMFDILGIGLIVMGIAISLGHINTLILKVLKYRHDENMENIRLTNKYLNQPLNKYDP